MDYARLLLALFGTASLGVRSVEAQAAPKERAAQSSQSNSVAAARATAWHGPWYAPAPPYPERARLTLTTGHCMLRITTEPSGWLKSVQVLESTGSSLLDDYIRQFAYANWKGPPNSATRVPVVFRLVRRPHRR